MILEGVTRKYKQSGTTHSPEYFTAFTGEEDTTLDADINQVEESKIQRKFSCKATLRCIFTLFMA